jgi:flagellum-specific ATP synthase
MGHRVEAEVVGFNDETLFLLPFTEPQGIGPGAQVRVLSHTSQVCLGPDLLGRIIDGRGQPLDGKPPPECRDVLSLQGRPINPMERGPIKEVLDVGVKAINGMLTIGRGQRLGLVAGSGVGKSVLLGMMARYTRADVIVVGLIGERGREVKEFIEDILGPEGRQRSVVVAAPADAPPLVRMQGASYATAIAERFRDDGLDVLLLMDSLTRYAMAQREIALAIGEPPATKGYPPSCFAKLPQLVERSGNGLNGMGSITAFYTVLSEGDDQQDPIADAARAILDGHIVLSRALAESGHFPAIDVEASASRVMQNVAKPAHLELARRFRALYSRFMKSRDLIQLGAYMAGSDPETDRAIALYPALQRFLMQGMFDASTMEASLNELEAALQDEGKPAAAAQGRPQRAPNRSA